MEFHNKKPVFFLLIYKTKHRVFLEKKNLARKLILQVNGRLHFFCRQICALGS